MCCYYFFILTQSEGKEFIKKINNITRCSFLICRKNKVDIVAILQKTKTKTKTKTTFGVFSYDGIRIGQGYDIHQIKVHTEGEDELNIQNGGSTKNEFAAQHGGKDNSEFDAQHGVNCAHELAIHKEGYALKWVKKNTCEQNFKILTIGGVKIKNIFVRSHSDGDIIYHSIVDSILGALGSLDIGTLFPDKEQNYQNKNSASFLRYVRLLLHKKKYAIANIDVNVIAEIPKIYPIRHTIIKNISSLLQIDESQINIKGKTHEKLGVIGEKKAVECFANDCNYSYSTQANMHLK
ncbi:2C-methyl-D-erythritol 2 [Plasmodium brasilianum]|uniref:2-C-methyl-D-erythritol 2,4-cyclodiphosphate synthase n=2 Tax=Plasmodium (Plasmodium) TaxID=418103 RepID=A0A1A8WLK5_PLAMA|nr:2C-methyl-D-erythritol 2 [Plasmodium brasilianum]SBS93800.1 2C-methyl-D-erythritol 2,4-cyclodiphosphate synthase, putative (IspF) [Plasmodium malariae]